MKKQTGFEQYHRFDNRLLMIGFGSIGQAVLPLIFRHLDIASENVTIITKKTDGQAIAAAYGVQLIVDAITPENYLAILNQHLKPGDFLLNLSVDVSSTDLIQFCQKNDVLYLDTCIEPWAGGYTDSSKTASDRSNYMLRENALALRSDSEKATAVLTHGANPGLISHFVKQALLNMADDSGIKTSMPTSQPEWARLAQTLGIKVIHIAERDTQVGAQTKSPGEFVNTWSVEGFIAEGSQPAELGWGAHEKHWPQDAHHHESGPKCAIYLNRPGASTRVRTWTPLAGPFHGFLITHSESISISNYLTLKKDGELMYRPTVHYAYHPCEDAVLSLHELAGREWQQQANQRLLFDEITTGIDELGVLLMGNKKGAYWFGSQLSIEEARQLAPNNTATSLQVAIGVLGAVLWAMKNPRAGVVEPEDLDFQFIMDVARPYLGKVVGAYTDWTPLQDRGRLFSEYVDEQDPWQFLNIRVN